MALVCGLFVTIALGVAAYFAYKTRSKIWRHGKPNIYWEEPPILRIDRSQNSQNWVSSSVAAQIYWGHCYWHSNVLACVYIYIYIQSTYWTFGLITETQQWPFSSVLLMQNTCLQSAMLLNLRYYSNTGYCILRLSVQWGVVYNHLLPIHELFSL